MNIIGVIPARYKSSRFPGKPLAGICRKPMIWWVYQQCFKVSELDEIYVATDYNMNVIMTSDKYQTRSDRVGRDCAVSRGRFVHRKIQEDIEIFEDESVYEQVKAYCDSTDIKIYNTNRGGKLEGFPCVDFDSLFSPQNT